MAVAKPTTLVRTPGAFRIRNFKHLDIALAGIDRDLDTLFVNAASTDVHGDGLQDLAALRAVAEADRSDKQLRLVEDAPGTGLGAIYRFDDTGVGADDANLVIVPDAGSGRWFKNSNVEGGFFSDGAGTNAVIGKGTVTPTAAGDDAFAHGDGSDAGSDFSFAQGKDNDIPVRSDSSFAQGQSNAITNGGVGYYSRYNFMQGKSNAITAATGFEAENNFAQGSNNTIAVAGGITCENFAQGSGNTINSTFCFVQGRDNTTLGARVFIQGTDNTGYQMSLVQGFENKAGYYSFSQGRNNTSGGVRCFSQGKDNRIPAPFQNCFAQGNANRVYVGTSFAQGSGNFVYSTRGFAQGNTNIIAVRSDDSFAQGYSNVITNGGVGYYSRYNFMQGKSNLITAFTNKSAESNFVQGKGNVVAPTSQDADNNFLQGTNNDVRRARSFVQGEDNLAKFDDMFIQGSSNNVAGGTSADRCFLQGRYNYAKTSNSFAQGYANDCFNSACFSQGRFNNSNAYGAFTQGATNNASTHSFAQGLSNDVYAYRSFAQGRLNVIIAGSDGCFAQGDANTIAARSANSLAQGNANVLTNGGVGYNSRYNFLQGKSNVITAYTGYDAERNFVQGLSNTIASLSAALNNSFAQGNSNTIRGSEGFAQGNSNTVTGLRGFAQGAFAHSKFDDAKVFGSNRAVLGKAQHGSVSKHLNTVDATADQVIAAIPIALASVMGFEVKVIGRGPSGSLLWTDLLDVQAYREAADAILNGAPTFTFTKLVLTTATVIVAVNTTDDTIEIKVTGEAATVIDWECRVTFLECVT